MKILNIMQCTDLGGMEQASLRTMQGLQKRGHECVVASLNPLGKLAPALTCANIPATGFRYRGPWGTGTILSTHRMIREHRPDAILMTGHHLATFVTLGNACRYNRVLAVHFHHSGVKTPWVWRMMYAIASTRFSAITFPSDFIRREAEALCPSIIPIAHTIRNPLDIPSRPISDDRSAARNALGLPVSGPVVGNAGWLIQRKRFDLFLRVAQRVAVARPDARFVIAGDGALRSSLQVLAQELGIGDKTLWLGWRTDMEKFYSAIDVLLFNADWDAFPTTPQEAMSWGVPVVASCLHGGLGEVISSDRVGVMFNNHDVNMLADAVLGFLRNSVLRESVGVAGRERIMELCNPDRIAVEMETLLSFGRMTGP